MAKRCRLRHASRVHRCKPADTGFMFPSPVASAKLPINQRRRRPRRAAPRSDHIQFLQIWTKAKPWPIEAPRSRLGNRAVRNLSLPLIKLYSFSVRNKIVPRTLWIVGFMPGKLWKYMVGTEETWKRNVRFSDLAFFLIFNVRKFFSFISSLARWNIRNNIFERKSWNSWWHEIYDSNIFNGQWG